MRKQIKVLFLLLMIFCCTTEKPFTIKGTVYGDIPAYIYLTYNNKKDSAQIKNHKFVFNGKVEKPTSAALSVIGVSSVNKVFYIDNSKLNLRLTNTIKKYKHNDKVIAVNFINIDTVFGNKFSKMQIDFEKFTNENRNKSNWGTLVYEKLDRLIEKNPKNIVLGDELYNLVAKKTLSADKAKKLFSKLNSEYQSEESKSGIITYINPIKKIAIGHNMFDFTLPTPNKTTINTTQYRGNYLFIHFWASWCAPCRKDNVALTKIYTQYKKNKLKILNVSTDTDLNKWKAAIREDAILWDNVIDIRKSESEILAKYDAVNSIPKSYLIDPKGIVLLVNPTVEELKIKLSRVLLKN